MILSASSQFPSLVASCRVFAQQSLHSESELEELLLSSSKEDGGCLLAVCGFFVQAGAARWCGAREAKIASFWLLSTPFLVLVAWDPKMGGPSGAGPTTEGSVQDAGPATKGVWQWAGPTVKGVLPMGGAILMTEEGPAAVTPSDAGDAGEGEELSVMVCTCTMEGTGKGSGWKEKWPFCDERAGKLGLREDKMAGLAALPIPSWVTVTVSLDAV